MKEKRQVYTGGGLSSRTNRHPSASQRSSHVVMIPKSSLTFLCSGLFRRKSAKAVRPALAGTQ